MHCLVCGADVETVFFGRTPVAGYVVDTVQESLSQPVFDLNMTFCPACSFARYVQVTEANALMDALYRKQMSTYSLTAANLDYVRRFAQRAIDSYGVGKDSLVMEIGCNDGAMLMEFQRQSGCRIVGVEPSTCFADVWRQRGIPVINALFSRRALEEAEVGQPDIIVLRHVLEHVFSLREFMSDLAERIVGGARLIVEFPYLKTVIDKGRIDNISYPHVNYFTIRSFSKLIAPFGLRIDELRLVETDGGSIVFAVSRGPAEADSQVADSLKLEDLLRLKQVIRERAARMEELLSPYREGEVIGYGAGAKGQHLFHLLGLGRYIHVMVDDMPAYQGRFMPATDVPIRKPSEVLATGRVKAVVNLATTHGEAVRSKLPADMTFIDVLYS